MRAFLIVLASFGGFIGCASHSLSPTLPAGDAAPDISTVTEADAQTSAPSDGAAVDADSGWDASGGSDTADHPAAQSFICGAHQCLVGIEYCFGEQADGIPRVGPECRTLPPGCSRCSCAKTEALAATINCVPGGSGSFVCRDSSGFLIDDQTSTPPSWIMCDVP